MEIKYWKTIAIVFIILFVIETVYLSTTVYLYLAGEDMKNECYYNICVENYDAAYESGVCTCYDLDLLGNYAITKTEYMK